eukprot:TRINITY_DN37439_c0_g1_i1.p1 TRINITY_DN37439_c0_g1~~TRINITY_DN37439_c0_g1_i1.p1  ORF type:complete len:270 (-),score=26.44 TRINITY_DN37439_c0_g1_i1:12-821(-)
MMWDIQRDDLLILAYGVLTISAWSSTVVSFLRDLSSHGKTLRMHNEKDKETHSILVFVRQLLLPKQYFLHFYVVGVISVAIVTVNIQLRFPEACFLILQVSRRLYECAYVHEWRKTSQMHLAAYLIGIFHYAILPFNFCVSNALAGEKSSSSYSSLQYASMLLCLYAQYEQHAHHRILAQLRGGSTAESKIYSLPKGRWFSFIGSPQYLAEILVYLSFVGMLQTAASLGLFLWVASNQVLSAWRTHKWYQQQYDEYRKEKRKALIPLLF